MALSEAILVILLTGGPSAGKTTVINRLLEAYGHLVAIVPEAATALFASGLRPPDSENVRLFQQVVLPYQQYNQSARINEALRNGAKVVVLDRGLLDGAAYIDNGLEQVLSILGQTLDQVYQEVDLVLHLETVALYHPERFGKAGNEHRIESDPQLAIDLDGRIREVWSRHPHWQLIDGSQGIEAVVEQVLEAVSRLILQEVERKWLIPVPPLVQGFISKQEIEQFYAIVADGAELRFRRITEDGRYAYFETIKTGGGVHRGENERPISQEIYDRFLPQAQGRVIRKTRYNFRDGQSVLSLDVFAEDLAGHATLEREFANLEQAEQYTLPALWKDAVEVTHDRWYKNVSLALHGLPQ